MKIAIITPNFTIAGVPLAQHRFARALVKKGHDVEFVIGCLPSGLSPPIVPGLKINVLHRSRAAKMFLPLIGLLKKNNYDLIFSAEDHLNVMVLLAAIIAGAQSKISCSSRVTPLDTYSNKILSKRWFLKQLTKLTMYRANVLSCVSKDMVLQYQKIFVKTPHVAIYNIVDDEFSRSHMLEPVEHDWFEGDDYKILVASGRLATWKGFEDLIRAMPAVLRRRKVKLLILGDGPLKDHLLNIIDELDLSSSVDLVGYVDNPLKYYKNADVFVLSSHVEGLPNVLVEAMMCGCTPVATNCPTGPREVLDDGKYGYLVPMHDSEALVKGVINAIDSPIDPAMLEIAIQPFQEDQILQAHFHSLGIEQSL
jgi:glycosyltransferase involved in cell wall biosynthesis